MFGFKKKQRKLIIDEEQVKDITVSDENIELKREYVNHVLKTRKLPIVLLDPLWHSAKEHIQSPIIDQNEKELQALIKEQARLNTDYKEYTVVKQNFLKQILNLSGKAQEDGNSDVVDELSRLHQSTLGANEKLGSIENRLSEIDLEIEDKNVAIVAEMVAIGYTYIDRINQENQELELEIEKLRAQMLAKINKKKAGDKLLKDIYNYLHSIVGREHIEVMDKTLGEKEKK